MQPAQSPPAEPRQDSKDERGTRDARLAILGIVTTLIGTLGAGLGAVWLTNRSNDEGRRQQLEHDAAELRQQLEHEDHTRYQELRLEAYSAFTVDMYHSLSVARHPRPLSSEQTQRYDTYMDSMAVNLNRVDLMGGPAVRDAAHQAHDVILVLTHPAGLPSDVWNAKHMEWIFKMNALQHAMRLELGTEVDRHKH